VERHGEAPGKFSGNLPDRRAEALPEEESGPRAPAVLEFMEERLEGRPLFETKKGDQPITGAVRGDPFACFTVQGIARLQDTERVTAATAEKPLPVRQ
jgi:hypothetical protein